MRLKEIYHFMVFLYETRKIGITYHNLEIGDYKIIIERKDNKFKVVEHSKLNEIESKLQDILKSLNYGKDINPQ